MTRSLVIPVATFRSSTYWRRRVSASCATTRPNWPDHDRCILSKGHATGALYSVLAAAGFFPGTWLDTDMQPQSKLNGHPSRNYLPGVETNTGPLGHRLPGAVGIAIARQVTGAAFRSFVVTGDGEVQEGSNRDAAALAGHRKPGNLTLIVDRNRLQQGAATEDTITVDPLDDRFGAFGWQVQDVDGHDPFGLRDILRRPAGERTKPLCVIANTVKGKGVPFMENDAAWHHGVPDAGQLSIAMKELA